MKLVVLATLMVSSFSFAASLSSMKKGIDNDRAKIEGDFASISKRCEEIKGEIEEFNALTGNVNKEIAEKRVQYFEALEWYDYNISVYDDLSRAYQNARAALDAKKLQLANYRTETLESLKVKRTALKADLKAATKAERAQEALLLDPKNFPTDEDRAKADMVLADLRARVAYISNYLSEIDGWIKAGAGMSITEQQMRDVIAVVQSKVNEYKIQLDARQAAATSLLGALVAINIELSKLEIKAETYKSVPIPYICSILKF